MVTSKDLILQSIGWIKQYNAGAIVHGTTANLGITQAEQDIVGFLNSAIVVNTSSADINVSLDGSSVRKILIQKGLTVVIANVRFNTVQVYNNDAATDITAGQVLITTSKELGNRELAELRAQGAY